MERIIPIYNFGKDHWSLLLYIETCCVDSGGKLKDVHMRTLKKGAKWEYGTRLNQGRVAENHDDWDCLNDFRAGGIVENDSNEKITLTDYGWQLVAQLRRRKADGLPIADFAPVEAPFVYDQSARDDETRARDMGLPVDWFSKE